METSGRNTETVLIRFLGVQYWLLAMATTICPAELVAVELDWHFFYGDEVFRCGGKFAVRVELLRNLPGGSGVARTCPHSFPSSGEQETDRESSSPPYFYL